MPPLWANRRENPLTAPPFPLLASVLAALCAGPAAAIDIDPARLCDGAAYLAAQRTGVPFDLLRAIARVESGRQRDGAMAPWPWTINLAGQGAHFATSEAAMNRVQQAMAEGQSMVDIGCFQINLHWHGRSFPSLEAMFDPSINALYAADYLSQLFSETGSWDGAVAAYHSRDADRGGAYLMRVAAAVAALRAPGDEDATPPAPRPNGYPLLQAAEGVGAASTVPLPEAGPALITASLP